MATIGIELCDAGFRTAACDPTGPKLLDVADRHGATDWPGFAFQDGPNLAFGRAAEDMWLVHPRHVAHTFWAKLARDSSSTLNVSGRPPSFSELAFFFLREFTQRLAATTGPIEKIVLAVPGAYLKDEATEEEKIGLLLGMVSELKLPLAGFVDMACAALCDPRAPSFNPALPIIVVDVHLEGADLTLLATDERLERKHFLHLPNSGYAQLLKHLTSTMGNRFLRHTAFDILEDGRVEQTFYTQTKEFLQSGAAEHRYQINTATRNYEMLAKSEQLAAGTQAFATTLVQGLQSFVDQTTHSPGLCTVALTARTALLPGLEAKLRSAGFARILRLPAGAAAAGAARLGESRLSVPSDLADVPVETSAPLSETRRTATNAWEVRLHKSRRTDSRPAPSHAIFDGLGCEIGGNRHFSIGTVGPHLDLVLPDDFNTAGDCVVSLLHEGGRLWFVDPATDNGPAAPRVALEAGDRLTIRCGSVAAEVLFAHCPGTRGTHE